MEKLFKILAFLVALLLLGAGFGACLSNPIGGMFAGFILFLFLLSGSESGEK